jgi:hypothetical protein
MVETAVSLQGCSAGGPDGNTPVDALAESRADSEKPQGVVHPADSLLLHVCAAPPARPDQNRKCHWKLHDQPFR